MAKCKATTVDYGRFNKMTLQISERDDSVSIVGIIFTTNLKEPKRIAVTKLTTVSVTNYGMIHPTHGKHHVNKHKRGPLPTFDNKINVNRLILKGCDSDYITIVKNILAIYKHVNTKYTIDASDVLISIDNQYRDYQNKLMKGEDMGDIPLKSFSVFKKMKKTTYVNPDDSILTHFQILANKRKLETFDGDNIFRKKMKIPPFLLSGYIAIDTANCDKKGGVEFICITGNEFKTFGQINADLNVCKIHIKNMDVMDVYLRNAIHQARLLGKQYNNGKVYIDVNTLYNQFTHLETQINKGYPKNTYDKIYTEIFNLAGERIIFTPRRPRMVNVFVDKLYKMFKFSERIEYPDITKDDDYGKAFKEVTKKKVMDIPLKTKNGKTKIRFISNTLPTESTYKKFDNDKVISIVFNYIKSKSDAVYMIDYAFEIDTSNYNLRYLVAYGNNAILR